MAAIDSELGIPTQRVPDDRLELPVEVAMRQLEDRIGAADVPSGVMVFGFEQGVAADPAAVACRRLRGALATMHGVWSPLKATFSRLREDRFLVIVDGLPDTVPAATFALALRYETCSALRTHDEQAAELFRVGVATPENGVSSAVDLVRRAEADTTRPEDAALLLTA